MHTPTEAGTAADGTVARQIGSVRGVSCHDLGMSRNVLQVVASSHSGNLLLAVPTGRRRKKAPEIRHNSHELLIT
jgi:hypothetical protein